MTQRISTNDVKKSANCQTSYAVMHNKSKYPAKEKFKNKFYTTVSAYESAKERLLASFSIIILNVLHNTLLRNVSETGHFNISGKYLIPNTRHNTINSEVRNCVDRSHSSVIAYCPVVTFIVLDSRADYTRNTRVTYSTLLTLLSNINVWKHGKSFSLQRGRR